MRPSNGRILKITNFYNIYKYMALQEISVSYALSDLIDLQQQERNEEAFIVYLSPYWAYFCIRRYRMSKCSISRIPFLTFEDFSCLKF